MDKRRTKAKDPALEDELRKMILSNVTIGGPGQPQSPDQQQRTRNFRGSSRGNFAQNQRNPNANNSQENFQHEPTQRFEPPRARGGFRQAPHASQSPTQNLQVDQQSGQPMQMNPDAFGNRGMGAGRGRGRGGLQSGPGNGFNQQPRLWQGPRHAAQPPPFEDFIGQCQFLERIASVEIPQAEMQPEDAAGKESFRQGIEKVCRQALAESPTEGHANFRLDLKGFGSVKSGFAMKGSDMDLAISLTELDPATRTSRAVEVDTTLLRIFEKALLDRGVGARLLTRTRVPIIKVCEAPTTELYAALREERQRWEQLPDDKKESPPSPQTSKARPLDNTKDTESPISPTAATSNEAKKDDLGADSQAQAADGEVASTSTTNPLSTPSTTSAKNQQQGSRVGRKWFREKILGPLDFPKHGVGNQCDINFSNDLALHNTHLLRCYSLCDARVTPMVLFVKAWAKRRKINSAYSGTLSSYGYVLMVLHFLANKTDPPVIPNLQLRGGWQAAYAAGPIVNADHDIRFWNDERTIQQYAMAGQLTSNKEPLGALLRNFFQYYANTHQCFGIGRGFQWTHEVLSLRTPGGLLTKQEKRWTGAKTTTVGDKEVRNRYLFAIEDPFELEHNVARTVTHNGVVAIRDEFRRAWRIIVSVGRTEPAPERFAELFAEVEELNQAELAAKVAARVGHDEKPSTDIQRAMPESDGTIGATAAPAEHVSTPQPDFGQPAA